jgi:hypothetical protein
MQSCLLYCTILFVISSCCWQQNTIVVNCQIATPVDPIYDLSVVPAQYKTPLVPDDITWEGLKARKALRHLDDACQVGAHRATHGNNRLIFNFPNVSELHADPNFLWGTTYWVNDYLHVGHVHYDIVLIQLMQLTKIDRIVLQRTVCHGSLCKGLGVMDSFYKAYYNAVMEAGGQPNVPVYLRWDSSHDVQPIYFSTKV